MFALEHVNPGNRDPSSLSTVFVAQQWHGEANSLRRSNSSAAKFHPALNAGACRGARQSPGLEGAARSGGPEAAAMLSNAQPAWKRCGPQVLKLMRVLKLLLARPAAELPMLRLH